MRSLHQKQGLSYCGVLAYENDYDRFLISMFLPEEIRPDVWVLLAFNYEISKTSEVVTDTSLGMIRLQWWRDAIGDIFEDKSLEENEVIKSLSEVIKRHELPKEGFDALINAREFDLEDVLPANIEGLMNYAEFTTQPLYELVLQVMGVNPSNEIVQPVAVNYALVGIIRSVVWKMQEGGRFLLPEDLLEANGVTKDNFFRDSTREGVKNVIKSLVEGKLASVKPDNVFLKASESLSDIYFRQIISNDYDILSPSMGKEPFFKVLRLFMKTKLF